MSTLPLVIVGAGRHGLELDAYLQESRPAGSSFAGYIDDNKPRGAAWGSSAILGGIAALGELCARERSVCYITATGSNLVRRGLVARIVALGCSNLSPWTLRHPFASVGERVEIGAGTCLAPGAIVTTHVTIGRHVILNVKASVSHDCVVGDYVNLNPGATVCGNVNIGEGSFIGAGATVINGINVGEWSVVGAGAAVVRDVPPRVTVVGVPARIIKHHEA